MGSGAHNERLQSLRGVAALCVLLGHVSMVLPFGSLTFHWAGVFQPNSAVIFFYVLSGYVLGESLRRDTSFARFVMKRMTRLLPVFWLAVLLGAATHILVAGPPIPGASDWLNGNRAHPVSALEIIQNLTAYAVSLNGSLWSIQVELIMIPILPLMVYVSGRLSWAGNVAALAALCALSRLLFTPVRSLDGSQLFFLAYLNCFYLGIALPKLLECRWRAHMTSGVVAACGLALSIHLYKYWPHWGISTETKLVLDSIISGQIVAWALAGRESLASRLIQSRPLACLGDWSYSFYCFSLPIMVIVACFITEGAAPSSLEGTFGTLLFLTGIGALTLAIVLPISYCSFRFIEAPLTQLGRKLAGHVQLISISSIRSVQPETR